MSFRHLTRWLYLGHRWLGIALGTMVLLWFLSGLVMLFVARPEFSETERLASLPHIDAKQVRISPLAAWQALGLSGAPESIRLDASGNQPTYRILAHRQWFAVDASSGRVLPPIDRDSARRLAERHAGSAAVENISLLERDQWTLYRRFDPFRPFWHIQFADGRELYVAMRSGELVLDTTPMERSWNWLGSVVHWLYFTPLRENPRLWRNLVLWVSFSALLLAFSGFLIGWQRLRLRNRYGGMHVTPYRSHWKRRHHLLGLAAALILCTWLVSGWLSLGPFGFATAPKLPAHTGTLLTPLLNEPPKPDPAARELEWRLLGQTRLYIEKRGKDSRIGRDGQPISPMLSLSEIASAANTLGIGTVRHAAWLYTADSRYYPLRHHPRAFPVARVEFDDAAATVLYISPYDGRIETISNRHDFAYRWLYLGLHRLDLPFLVLHPQLRDAAIILFSVFGIALSLTGCVLAWQRLRRRADKDT